MLSGAGSMGQESVRADDEAQNLDPNEPANREGEYNECTQMGSDSDDSDRDTDPEADAESGDDSSSSEDSRHESKESSIDNDDEWGVELTYEDKHLEVLWTSAASLPENSESYQTAHHPVPNKYPLPHPLRQQWSC